MLLSFRVANYKSIRREQVLHLQPIYDKSQPALPVAAIFGANAAGKSNVLDAFAFMVNAVCRSVGDWRHGIPRSPFRLNPEAASANSVFTVELLLDGVRWNYGFAVDNTSVQEEWLYCYPQNRRRIIVERQHGVVTTGTVSGIDRGLASSLAAAQPHALLLSLAGAGLFSGVLPIQHWFSTVKLLRSHGAMNDEQSLIRRLEAEPERSRLIDLIVAADTGINDVVVEHLLVGSIPDVLQRFEHHFQLTKDLVDAMVSGHDEDAGRLRQERASIETELEVLLPEAAVKRLAFVHGESRASLSFDEESHGTRVWLGYLGPTLDALDTGALLVVDEIDTSLHPHLTAQLVRLFRDPASNRNGAQLVFTTHDATLLGKYFGERILARDEVWFVEKNVDHETELFSLADFKARDDDNVERRYLTGSYGAIPQPGEHRLADAMQGRPA